MKTCFIFLFLSVTNFSFAQQQKKTEKLYDYNWKPCDVMLARYYSTIEPGDSGWLRHDYFIREKKLQMRGAYSDSACKIPAGLFHYFHANGNLSSTGRYVAGKKEGLWLSYHSNTMMSDSVFYSGGKPVGTRQQWFADGYPMDSSVYTGDGIAVHVNWFNNGSPSSAGRTINDTLQGKWQFFHKNGNLSASELYDKGKLVSREYYDEKGTLMSDTTNHDQAASFPGGEKAWRKYIYKQLYFPEQYKITGGDKAVVVVRATIDEDGNVINAEVSSPFYPAFDEIALKALKKSPKWNPAIHHNRKVTQGIILPVTFGQQE